MVRTGSRPPWSLHSFTPLLSSFSSSLLFCSLLLSSIFFPTWPHKRLFQHDLFSSCSQVIFTDTSGHFCSSLHGDRSSTHIIPSGCDPRFASFAWYRTKSNRHVSRRMLLKPKKGIVPTTDYQVPTYRLKKWNTYFNEKSKVTILTYIHMISYEYEYFGSARTPVTKSSTRDHTASLFCFIQDRSIPRSLQRWVSMKSSISQLTFFYFIIIAIEKPYTTARILENE